MQLSRTEIIDKLKEILIYSDESKRQIVENCSESSELTTYFGLTSIGLLYIVIAVEETFNIRFDNANMADFVTLGDVVNYVEKKIK